MTRALLIISLTFTLTLALIFGLRASVDALAVVLGVILGVAASVPTTFLVTYMLMRSRAARPDPSPQLPHHPPVVVINSPEKPVVSGQTAMPALAPPSPGRKWTVIGDVDTGE